MTFVGIDKEEVLSDLLANGSDAVADFFRDAIKRANDPDLNYTLMEILEEEIDTHPDGD